MLLNKIKLKETKQIHLSWKLKQVMNVTCLVCNCIQKRNDAWKATANGNTNDACQRNTENDKENIKAQEDNT
jgi:hypothetical protein